MLPFTAFTACKWQLLQAGSRSSFYLDNKKLHNVHLQQQNSRSVFCRLVELLTFFKTNPQLFASGLKNDSFNYEEDRKTKRDRKYDQRNE